MTTVEVEARVSLPANDGPSETLVLNCVRTTTVKELRTLLFGALVQDSGRDLAREGNLAGRVACVQSPCGWRAVPASTTMADLAGQKGWVHVRATSRVRLVEMVSLLRGVRSVDMETRLGQVALDQADLRRRFEKLERSHEALTQSHEETKADLDRLLTPITRRSIIERARYWIRSEVRREYGRKRVAQVRKAIAEMPREPTQSVESWQLFVQAWNTEDPDWRARASIPDDVFALTVDAHAYAYDSNPLHEHDLAVLHRRVAGLPESHPERDRLIAAVEWSMAAEKARAAKGSAS